MLTDVTVERYQCILLALTNCGQDSNNHSVVCAGLYHKLSRYSFIVDIVVFHKIMSLLENLSTTLQSSTLKWHHACTEIKMVQDTLDSLKESSDDFSDGILQTVHEIAQKCAIPVNNSDDIHKTRITSFMKPVVS